MSMDINDQELEDLMAELEAQTAELVANDPTPTVVVESEPMVTRISQVEQVEVVAKTPDKETLNKVELGELEAKLASSFEPTAVDEMDAEQSIDLDEVFAQPTEAQIETVEVPKAEPKPIEAPMLTPTETPKAEPSETAMAEPIKAPVIEQAEAITPTPKEVKPLTLDEKVAREVSKLKFQPDELTFRRDIKVSDVALDQCMQDQSSLMAYYTAQHARAEAQFSRVKREFNTLEAGLYDAYRKRFILEGEKATEKAIENAVRMDNQWVVASLKLIEAQTYADIHKGFVQTLRDRKDMLVQLGSDRREEMKGQTRIVRRLDPESPARQQERVDSGSVASRALELARASMGRAG